VHPGHNEVEQDQIGFLRLGDGQSVKSVIGLKNGKPLLHKVMRVKAPQEVFVVNNKYFSFQNIPMNKSGNFFALFLVAKSMD